MTVGDEKTKGKKYMYLKYIEFLEFLCRIALECQFKEATDNRSATIYQKVTRLLKIIFNYRNDEEIDEEPLNFIKPDDSSDESDDSDASGK